MIIDPITIGAVGVGAYLLSKRKKGSNGVGIEKLQTPDRGTVQKILDNYTTQIQIVTNIINKDFGLICAFIAQESGGDLQAKGSAGEIGLMQLTSGAISDVDNSQWGRSNFSIDDLFHDWHSQMYLTTQDMTLEHALLNIWYGVAYFHIIETYIVSGQRGTQDDAVRAYNVGATGALSDKTKGHNYMVSVRRWQNAFFQVITGG